MIDFWKRISKDLKHIGIALKMWIEFEIPIAARLKRVQILIFQLV